MNIDKLIKKATLEKNGPAKEAYRAIKAELLLNSSSKNPKPEGKSLITKTFTIGVEEEPFDITINELDLSIIRKQIVIREEQISMYDANSRKELADMYREQLNYLRELLPPDVSKEKIQEAITTSYPYGYTQKEMGKVVKEIKAIYPMADGKLIAETVKQYIQ
jgi:uncharacterized protein YqeY